MLVIGICGSKGAGKSTAFTLLEEKYGKLLQEIPIAQHLKDVCSEISGLSIKYFTSQELKEKELEEYIVLDKKMILALFDRFFLKEGDYNFDLHVRPHINKVFHTPRLMLQYVGTEILRPIDENIHVKTVLKKMKKDKVVVLPDVRFNSEFDYFSNNSEFLPLYINNNDAEAKASVDSHKSELEFRDFCHKSIKVDNNGSINDLRENLLKVVKEFKELK